MSFLAVHRLGAQPSAPTPDRSKTVEALQEAKRLLEDAESYYQTSESQDGNAYYRSRSERAYQEAATYATVAQAEALTRLAEVAETLLEALSGKDQLFDTWGRMNVVIDKGDW